MFAYFLEEMTPGPPKQAHPWMILTFGSYSSSNIVVDLILENEANLVVKVEGKSRYKAL